MTKEEAIESFKCSNEQAKLRLEVEKMRMNSGEIKELEFYIERDEMAIKALEQEPCEDAISRQSVNEIINDIRDCISVEGYWAILERLKKLPPINPQEPKWIPLTTRPMTEEETEHYFEYTDMRMDDTYTILDCPLPDDGQEVLVSWGGNVGNDVFIQDNKCCYFEGMDIDEVDAWMPLPKPYEPQKRSE